MFAFGPTREGRRGRTNLETNEDDHKGAIGTEGSGDALTEHSRWVLKSDVFPPSPDKPLRWQSAVNPAAFRSVMDDINSHQAWSGCCERRLPKGDLSLPHRRRSSDAISDSSGTPWLLPLTLIGTRHHVSGPSFVQNDALSIRTITPNCQCCMGISWTIDDMTSQVLIEFVQVRDQLQVGHNIQIVLDSLTLMT
jgi:hypothetical protein